MDISLKQIPEFTKIYTKIILFLLNDADKRKGFLFVKDAYGFCSKVRDHGTKTIDLDDEQGHIYKLCAGCFMNLVQYQMKQAKVDLIQQSKLRRQYNFPAMYRELNSIAKATISVKEAEAKYRTIQPISTEVLEKECYKILSKMCRKRKINNKNNFNSVKTVLQLLIVHIS